MNSDFERWVSRQAFSGLDTPISDGVKRLMQRAFEGGQECQAAKDANVIEALNELDDAVTPYDAQPAQERQVMPNGRSNNIQSKSDVAGADRAADESGTAGGPESPWREIAEKVWDEFFNNPNDESGYTFTEQVIGLAVEASCDFLTTFPVERVQPHIAKRMAELLERKERT